MRAKQPVMINDIEFDALISQDNSLESTVPEYAVEDGFPVSDTIILNPEKINMVLYVTDTPISWIYSHGHVPHKYRTENIVYKLRQLYFKREPVTIKTSTETFVDMAIESMTISKSVDTGYAREIPISFKQIKKTEAKTTSIPSSYGKSETTQQQTGSANTGSGSSGGSKGSSSSSRSSGGGGSSNSGSNGSILYGIGSSIGLIN